MIIIIIMIMIIIIINNNNNNNNNTPKLQRFYKQVKVYLDSIMHQLHHHYPLKHPFHRNF